MRADQFAFVPTALPIEDLDDRVLFTGDINVTSSFVNGNAFATVQIGVAIRALFGELPRRIIAPSGV